MPRDYCLYLEDIIEAAEKVKNYTEGMDYDSFTADSKTVDAVIRNLGIIGEAVRNLPEEIKTRSGVEDLEWKKIITFRNIVIHQYFGVNLRVVWDIVQNKIQPLKESCQKLLEKPGW